MALISLLVTKVADAHCFPRIFPLFNRGWGKFKSQEALLSKWKLTQWSTASKAWIQVGGAGRGERSWEGRKELADGRVRDHLAVTHLCAATGEGPARDFYSRSWVCHVRSRRDSIFVLKIDPTSWVPSEMSPGVMQLFCSRVYTVAKNSSHCLCQRDGQFP